MNNFKENIKPKYCKVCHDTGKDEKTYTSHYVRETPDPTSRIVCPTLLSMECKYCYKKGHTVKFCKVIKNRSYKSNRSTKFIPTEKKETKPISNNMYALLESDDNEVELEATSNDTPHMFYPRSPTSSPPPIDTRVSVPLSYAKIIEVTHKQLAEEEMERSRRQAEEEKRKREEEAAKAKVTAPPASYFKPIHIRRMLNWADDTSSDEEYVYAE